MKLDKQELTMKIKQDENDKMEDDELEAFKKQQAKANNFMRLVRISEPKINIFLGVFVSICQGMIMPWFGILLAKMLFVLNYFYFLQTGEDVREDSNKYCLHMFIASLIAFFTGFF